MSSASLRDVHALRALAHPARLDLLDLLRVHDRLTAAECARLLGTSTKSCSYHLGVLAAQGMVVRAEKSGEKSGEESGADGRERPWRRAIEELEAPAEAGSGTDQQARSAAMLVSARRDLDLFTAFLDREPAQPASWREAVTVNTRTAVMSAAQLREWGLAVEALTREHVQRARQEPQDGAGAVRLSIRGFPQSFPASASGDG